MSNQLGVMCGKHSASGTVAEWRALRASIAPTVGPILAMLELPVGDGGVTTQPEYSFWFEDVGWGVENYGTDPDIEVEVTPADWVAGRDPQLERAIAEVQRLLEENPLKVPDFDGRPRKPLPTLPD